MKPRTVCTWLKVLPAMFNAGRSELFAEEQCTGHTYFFSRGHLIPRGRGHPLSQVWLFSWELSAWGQLERSIHFGQAAILAAGGCRTQKLWPGHMRGQWRNVISAQHGFGLRKGIHAMLCPSRPHGMPLGFRITS